jgi:hypothetical protein
VHIAQASAEAKVQARGQKLLSNLSAVSPGKSLMKDGSKTGWFGKPESVQVGEIKNDPDAVDSRRRR